jgi:hypothetical protein
MDLRGQRFTVDLSDDEEETGLDSRIPTNSAPSLTAAFIGDIKERSPAPPSAPKLKTTTTGFPEHKKRTRVSAFKQQRVGASKDAVADSHNAFALPKPQVSKPTQDPTADDEERKRINEENKLRLADMSAEEIDEERHELLSQLNPSLIERLLKRANLDDGRGDTGLYPGPEPAKVKEEEESQVVPGIEESVSQKEPEAVPAPQPAGKPVKAQKGVTFADDDKPPSTPIDLQPASEPLQITQPSIHFPTAPQAPELDPSDPSFLENLHQKYFPSLPADPSKLAWMAPIPTHGSVADQDSPYYPLHENIPASALRFDFRGSLLPPRISRAMPSRSSSILNLHILFFTTSIVIYSSFYHISLFFATSAYFALFPLSTAPASYFFNTFHWHIADSKISGTKGLHHHGEAPEAAGYTVPELARLARSAFPAQRCVAFQTLGRLLYRLGRGEWGGEERYVQFPKPLDKTDC